MPQQHHRIEGLDALRGLAALVVFNTHCILVLAVVPAWVLALIHSPLAPLLIGGHDAVLFFFLLSGFVLFLPYTRSTRPRPWLPFVVKRTCRIYLPYLAGIAFAIAGWQLTFRLQPLPGISEYFSWAPISPPDFRHLLLQHIAFLGSFHRERWNSATWTVAEEMRISLIFPFLAAILVRLGTRRTLALALLTSAAVWVAIAHLHHRFPLLTLHYAGIFLLGASLARHRATLLRAWFRLGRPLQTLLSACSLLALAYVPYLSFRLPPAATEPIVDWLLTLPLCALLVSALAQTWFTRLLEARHMQTLGRISYSVYLLHIPCLYASIELLWNQLPTLAVFAIALAATLALSLALFRFVEEPSMALGKRLSTLVTANKGT